MYRAMAKHRLEGGALWMGIRSSFERFADKDPSDRCEHGILHGLQVGTGGLKS